MDLGQDPKLQIGPGFAAPVCESVNGFLNPNLGVYYNLTNIVKNFDQSNRLERSFRNVTSFIKFMVVNETTSTAKEETEQLF